MISICTLWRHRIFLFRRLTLLVIAVFSCVVVFSQVTADFNASVTAGCSPLLVKFTDASSGAPSQWLWDLGNGVRSTIDNPSTIYSTPGTYTVKLRIRGAGGEDSIIKTNYITVYAKPTPKFSVSPATGCIPLDVNFVDSSDPGSGTIQSWVWDFGDGTSSIDQSPAHTYISAGTFNVSLFLVNSFGCQQSVIKPAIVNPSDSVHADFDYNYTNICRPPTLVNFTNKSVSASPLTYAWDFGNGATSAATNPSQTYTTPGTFNVRLIANNGTGCADTVTHPISIGNVSANFSIPQGICINEPAVMQDSSSPVAVSATWDFGDGTTGTGLSVTHTYTTLGTYTVTYTANFGGCTSIVTKTVNVTGKPVAAFNSASVLTSCTAPLTVAFNNTSAGAAGYLWDFGDGSTSTEFAPQHTYTISGNFTVKLTATSAGGCSHTITRTNYVRINQPKITGFSNLPFLGCAPATVPFKAIITSPEKIDTYLWSFGDGATSGQQAPTHTYQNTGTFNVTLTVTTVSGCTATYTLPSAVDLSPKPVAAFNATPVSGCASDSIHFRDESIGNVDTWTWLFGDGYASSSQNPIHHYRDTGNFSVVLIVASNGCSDTLERLNYINIDPPVAAFTTNESCALPYIKDFQDNSIAPQSWNWDFGDGSTSTIPSPSHTYTTPGTYTATLIVKNAGCSDTLSNTILVIDEQPKFKARPLAGKACKYNDIEFSAGNLNMANVTGIRWIFGDGITTVFSVNNDTIIHRFDSAATFNTRMIVSYINGCYDTIFSETPIVIKGPKADFSNAAGTCAGSLFTFTDLSIPNTAALTRWDWNFGDGNTATFNSRPFQHTYADSGTYAVQLKVYDADGCYDSVLKAASVIIGKPYAIFSIADTLKCTSNDVVFVDSSAGLSLQYTWDFGDGTTSAQQSPVHRYQNEGIYTVKLKVTDVYGCMDSMVKPASVTISNPIAAFTISDSASRCTLPVQTTSQSQNYSTLNWDFGDGGTSTLDDPFHLYTVPGPYKIMLVAQGYGTCYDTAYRNVELKGPYGTFQFTNNDGCFPHAVNFKATATSTVAYIWDFGDGAVKKTIPDSTSYTYTTPGIFVPRLLLEDSSGCTVAIESSDTAKILGVKPKFYFQGSIGCDSSLVSFTDSSYVSLDPLASVVWNFGDGNTSGVVSPGHYYKASGDYLVTQTVTSVAGCISTYTLPIQVDINKAPKLVLSVTDSACVNSEVLFGVTDTAAIPETLQWLWNIGNGNQYNTPSFSYTYTAPGVYTVSVTATADVTGCADTVSKSLTILGLPAVNAGVDTSICVNTFATLSPSGAASYVWVPNASLSCTNCTNPLAGPSATTTYYVTGADAFGCQASDSVVVNVVLPTRLVLSTNSDTLCTGSFIQLAASGADRYQWQPPTGLSNPGISNPVATPSVSTLYTVTGSDNVGCFADTQQVYIEVAPLPVFSIKDSFVTLNAGSQYTITTTSSPDVISWKWEPPTGLQTPVSAQPVASPKTKTTYIGTGINNWGCTATDQITIDVLCNNANVFIPNTFSPNRDGVNEIFLPRGKGLYSIKSMKVFNRWGVAVFEKWNFAANNQTQDGGWDGNYQGKPQPSDVYIYVIDIVCENGTPLSYKGNVTLIR